jgi:hypothetical protein
LKYAGNIVKELTVNLSEYLVPFIVSNVVALILLGVAILWPRVARWTFAVIFLAAGVFNVYTAITAPESYLMYGETAFLPLYRSFIAGVFSRATAVFVLLIAAGQLTVGALLTQRGLAFRLGALGACIFLAAIIPLGIGSAFPFSLIAIAAIVVMAIKLTRRWADDRSGGIPQAA